MFGLMKGIIELTFASAPQGFQGMHGMYNHVRVHHLQTEHHVCPECQASFTSARALSEHARKVCSIHYFLVEIYNIYSRREKTWLQLYSETPF